MEKEQGVKYKNIIGVFSKIVSWIFDTGVLISSCFFISWFILMLFLGSSEWVLVMSFLPAIIGPYVILKLYEKYLREGRSFVWAKLIKITGSILVMFLFMIAYLFKQNYVAKYFLHSVMIIEKILNNLIISSIFFGAIMLIGIIVLFSIAGFVIRLFPKNKQPYILFIVVILFFTLLDRLIVANKQSVSVYLDFIISKIYLIYGFSLFFIHFYYLVAELQNLIRNKIIRFNRDSVLLK